ncbi:MAG: hypothetical protein ABI846_02935 [Rudaea sp.]
MRLAVWLSILLLVALGHLLSDDRFIAAVAPLVIAALWFGAPKGLRPAIAVVAVVLLGAWLAGGVGLLVDALPATFAGLAGWLFARTLMPGRQPLIARAIRVIDGPGQLGDPAIARYARRLTELWMAVQFALTLLGLACAARAHGGWPPFALPTPALFGGLILPAVVAALFVAEFGARAWLLPQAPRKNLVAFARSLARAWPELIEE